ncbi:MAG: hypothetical protein R2879_19435 [Saprospiraceae bacterium]
MIKPTFLIFILSILTSFNIAFSQNSLLPIYSNPMVFIDSLGKVVGILPAGYKILNTKVGNHDGGYVHGMAGNSVSAYALIPAIDFNTSKISFFDKTGRFLLSYGNTYEAITPNINGFHLATKVDRKGILPRTSYTFLDAKGNQVFEYNGFYKADVFTEDLAAINNRGWHYIDSTGQRYDLIDSSLTKDLYEVTSFSNGVSKIRIRKGRYQSGDHYRYVFIDKKGNTVLDTDNVFPDEHIALMGDMHDSISRIIFQDERGYTTWGETAYLKLNGEVLGRFDSLFRIKEFSNGFVPILPQTKRKGTYENVDGFILTTTGERIGFGENKKVRELVHINDQFFWVYLADKKDKSTYSGVFDAIKREFIYRNKHDIMGIKWDLISLRDSRSKRYYVVNYKTGEIVYDTDKSNLVFSNIQEALKYKNEVTKYVCLNAEDVASLGELKNLKELSLRKIDLVAFPENFTFENLEILKIDGLRKLEKLPDHIKNLKKLSLRDCTEANNLMSMVSGLTGLEELFIINFDLTTEEKNKITAMYPDTKVTIKGKKANADSELQEVIFGF